MYVMGDIHGQFVKMVARLGEAGLIDGANHWAAGRETLWFMGDYFDRGPDGIAAVDLIRALQAEADAAGGRVGALVGNHDVLIMAARRFGERPSGGPGGNFLASWRANGGEQTDLERLTDDHVAWLASLPALALAGGRLLAHADATFYQVYGRTVAGVNSRFRAILRDADDRAWDSLLDYFSQRRAFQDDVGGPARVRRFLDLYGGRQLVHGHTPITKFTGRRAETITEPYLYAGGLAIDVDAGMYLGSPGFIVEVPELD